MVSTVLNIIGLVSGIYASYLLSKNLFISDDEIEELSKLPIEKSSTHLSTGDGVQKAVAIISPIALDTYRKNVIERRKRDRLEGKKGFRFLILGFMFQIVALITPSL